MATTRTPGAAWPGGYLTVAVMLALITAWSAASLDRRRWPATEVGLPAPSPRSLGAAATPPRRIQIGRVASRVTRGLAAVDGWLVEQPGLALVVVGAIACLFIFR